MNRTRTTHQTPFQFFITPPLPLPHSLIPRTLSPRFQPCKRHTLLVAKADNPHPSLSSSAINQDPTHSSLRYIDLRTMKLIPPTEAHMRPTPTPDVTFGIFDNPHLFDDHRAAAELRDLLFTQDTIPLNDTQKMVVQTLLSRRSVLYMAASGNEKDSIFIDIVMRNRLWKECVVYCAASRRAAETVYAMLCAQLGSERRAEVCLDLGNGGLEISDSPKSKDNFRVIITSPYVLKSNLVKCDPAGWLSQATIVFIDNFSVAYLQEWEEILLAMPARILLCMFMKEPAAADRELLPLWLEAIQNTVVSISPSGASSLHDRIDRPQNFPLLRTFAFNAALHESPVQVSLTLVKEMLQKERENPGGDFVPRFAECFLHGITTLPAEKTTDLSFATIEEAEYADVVALIVADAKKTEERVRARSKKRARSTKRPAKTAASKAAARRRREAACRDSMLLPAIVLTNGRREAENAAFAIRSALGKDVGLLWDEDSKELLEELVKGYERERVDQLSETDIEILQTLLSGIGIVHDGCAPAIRMFVEELFRGQFLSVIVADTHLGSSELLALPCAKSVLVESTALALCDDLEKGLVKASTAAALAGRMGKDDVGNLIVLWYDEAVDDESAGNEIASTLLYPLFSTPSETAVARKPSSTDVFDDGRKAKIPDFVKNHLAYRVHSSALSSTYDGVLRSLRRFGADGFESILDFTLHSYKGWLQRVSLHATVEKMEMEMQSIDEKLDEHDKVSIADHERRIAKKNEVSRVFNAMKKRYGSVINQRFREELQLCKPGQIIGVKSSKASEDGQPWEQKILGGGFKDDERATFSNAKQLVKTEIQKGEDRIIGQGIMQEGLTAAVFVAIRDQGSVEKRSKPVDQHLLVVCILADGLWTMLPIKDVVGLSEDEDDVVPNVDLLMIPHAATFDVDPSSEWAKCFPVDDVEKSALYRISDELISRMASEDKRPTIESLQIPEYEAQRERLEKAESLYQQSPWYGRDDELLERRRLRRRGAELGDEISAFQEREIELEERMFRDRNHEMTSQSAVLAILEDCHAVSILGDNEMDMTPIGALGSVLPGEYPLFTATCLSLIEDIDELDAAEFAAFVAVVACSGRLWSGAGTFTDGLVGGNGDMEGDNEELDLSMLEQFDEDEEEVGMLERRRNASLDGLDEILPLEIATMVQDILVALEELHRRHRLEQKEDGDADISQIVPMKLNIRLSKAVHMFASGVQWRDVAEVLNREEGYGVREVRHVQAVLEVVAQREGEGEFSERMREVAREAYKSLDRWPIRDRETIIELVESGVVEKHWNGNTYEKWWRGARDEIGMLNGLGKGEGEEESVVERAEAEIMESQ